MPDSGPLPSVNPRRRNKRPMNDTTVDVKRPPTPRELKGEERAMWRRTTEYLESVGLINEIDRSQLLRYCFVWGDWVALNALLRDPDTWTVFGPKGGVMKSPEWLQRVDCEKMLQELERMLGIGPTARLRVGIKHERPPEQDTEDIEAIDDYKARLAAVK